MSDHAKLGWIMFLTILGLLLYMVAFGDGLPPRPTDYTPIDYLAVACKGLYTDTTVVRFGVDGDVRWAEIYVEDRSERQQPVAVVAFGPGVDGILTAADVLLPSGQVVHFSNRSDLAASPYAEVCAVAAVWLNRTEAPWKIAASSC